MDYQKKADKLFQRKFVELNPKCEMCGKPTACGHHFIPKSASSALRYNPLNMVPVCAGCHLKFHSKHSAEIIGRIIEKRGVDWFKSIQKEKVKIIKTNTEYYKDALCTIESMTK